MPEKLLQELKCKIGLHDKTHKRIKNKIQEIGTGAEFTPLNIREKSSLNKIFQNKDSHLYFLIYDDFSALSHPDLRSAHFYFQNDHDIHYNSNLDQLANFYCSVISIMILFEFYKMDLFKEPFQNDIEYHIQLVSKTIIDFFKLTDEASSGELIYVQKRVKKTLNEIKKYKNNR